MDRKVKIFKHKCGTVKEPHDPVLVEQYYGQTINNWNSLVADFAIRGTHGGKFELVPNGFKYTTTASTVVIFSLEV